MSLQRVIVSGLAGCALLSFATAAHAGQCPAADVREGAITTGPMEPKGVTDNVLGSVDLSSEINVPSRSLRLRRLDVQPGGIVPWHSHVDRPALIIVVKGEMTEYRSNCASPIVHKTGELSQEAGGISHYWKNNGKTPAVLYSSDVFHMK